MNDANQYVVYTTKPGQYAKVWRYTPEGTGVIVGFYIQTAAGFRAGLNIYREKTVECADVQGGCIDSKEGRKAVFDYAWTFFAAEIEGENGYLALQDGKPNGYGPDGEMDFRDQFNLVSKPTCEE